MKTWMIFLGFLFVIVMTSGTVVYAADGRPSGNPVTSTKLAVLFSREQARLAREIGFVENRIAEDRRMISRSVPGLSPKEANTPGYWQKVRDAKEDLPVEEALLRELRSQFAALQGE